MPDRRRKPRQYGLSWIEDVRAFHEAMDVPILEAPELPDDRVELRASLIEEECHETLLALMRGDLVEVADGLADVIYVCIGAALEFGIPLDAVWHEVHRSNMEKVGGPIREDGKRLKPEGWTPPDIQRVLDKAMEEARR